MSGDVHFHADVLRRLRAAAWASGLLPPEQRQGARFLLVQLCADFGVEVSEVLEVGDGGGQVIYPMAGERLLRPASRTDVLKRGRP